MIERLPSQYLLFLAMSTTLLLVATRIQSCNSIRNPNADCRNKDIYYNRSYDSVSPGLKVLDALRAQTAYIEHSASRVFEKFVPLLPGRSRRRPRIDPAYIKSVIELIRMNEKYQELNGMDQEPQLALTRLLTRKVAEESCQWLNESPDISIPDCTNIDLAQLEKLYLRMDLYQTLWSTYSNMLEITNTLEQNHRNIYYCAWMNDRILGKCADQNRNYRHRESLNNLCRGRGCDPQLCSI